MDFYEQFFPLYSSISCCHFVVFIEKLTMQKKMLAESKKKTAPVARRHKMQ